MRKKNKKVSLAKKPFLVLSRRAIAGWLAVIFIVCGWMFAIGVLVGRGTAPLEFDVTELQRKLERTVEALKKKERGRDPQEPASVTDKPEELDYNQALKDDHDDAKMPEKATAPVVERKEAPPPEDKPSKPKKESLKKKTFAKKREKATPESPIGEPAKSSETSVPDKKGDTKPADKPHVIQVAAFKDPADADKKVAELKQKGFPAYRAIGKVPGQGIWYRVRVGEYKSRADARQMMENLKKAGMQPIIVEK